MKRVLITIGVSAVLTSVSILYWLHDGDLLEAVEPVVDQWKPQEESPKSTDPGHVDEKSPTEGL
jgi:hypothetical protein